MHKHFKSIVRIANPEAMDGGWSLNKLINQYNGKPFLSNKTHDMARRGNTLILCFDVHRFSYLARKMYFEQLHMFGKLVLDVGFVVEGREQKYLPEQLVGCVRLIMFDPETSFPGVSDVF